MFINAEFVYATVQVCGLPYLLVATDITEDERSETLRRGVTLLSVSAMPLMVYVTSENCRT